MTINGTWAYNKNDRAFKSSTQLIRTLVEVASRGGNFLLNVGPQPDGIIQPEFTDRLKAIGKWLRSNGDSIYGSTYGPLQNAKGVRTTAKGGVVFVHVFDWSGTKLELTCERFPKFASASLLATGRPLSFQQHEAQLSIDLPAGVADPDVTVIALKTAGASV
jgi:alpha-L-fucosidase